MYVVVQFYPWFICYFLLLLHMIMCDNEYKTKEIKKIEPQHVHDMYIPHVNQGAFHAHPMAQMLHDNKGFQKYMPTTCIPE